MLWNSEFEHALLGTAFIQVLPFSLVPILPLMLHTRLNLHDAFTRRTNERSLGHFIILFVIIKIGEHWAEKYFTTVSVLKSLSEVVQFENSF
jgi:hypothetical protein